MNLIKVFDDYVTRLDFPGLKNPAAIEELRKQVLSAFRAYTTGMLYSFVYILIQHLFYYCYDEVRAK